MVQLPSLDTLDLTHCGGLRSLPPSMGGLTKLRVLNISDLGMQELLEDFGKLQSLVDINASGCSSLSKLSSSLVQVPNLDTFDLTGCG